LGVSADSAAWIGRVSLLAAVLAAPWFLGGVQAWVQVWIFGVVLVALGCSAIYLLLRPKRRDAVTIPLAIVPLLLAIGLGAVQLIPLDRSSLDRVSPKSAAIADEFLAASDSREGRILPGQDAKLSYGPTVGLSDSATVDSGAVPGVAGLEEAPARRPATVYPAGTRQSLALLILATSVFFLAAILFSRPATHLWLLGLIAANGAAIAFFGLAQNLTWNGQIYWSVILTQGGGPFGPFVNRNNGGGYLVLCLAAAIGLTLWCLARYFQAWDSTSHSARTPHNDTDSWVKTRVLSAIADLNAPTLTWLTIAGLLVAAICCTLSRGSVLAMAAAVLVTVTAMTACQRRGPAVLWPVAAMAIGLLLIGWVGLSDEVGARLATLFDDETVQQSRLPHWQDGLKAAADYPHAGSGMGTYRFVYAQYQERLAQSWFHYAENVYLQVLVEAGIAGLALFLAGLALVAAGLWRLMTRGDDLTTLAFAVAGVFALAGQAVASLFDFGLFIPANFLLFALLCGTVAGSSSRFGSTRRRVAGFWRQVLNRGVAVAIACGLFAGCLWGLAELRSVVPVEKAMREVRLAGKLKDLSAPQLAYHIDQLTAASQSRPGDAEVHRRLAELWMQQYQVETAKELQARTSFAADDPRLAQLASPVLIHQRAWLFTRSKMADQLDELRKSATVRKNLIPALEHLLASRRACPLLPEVHCGIAQLCALAGPVSEDERHIGRTRRLAPGDPDMQYVCGLLEFQAARFESAYAGWKASLSLSPRYLDPVLQIAGAGLATPGAIELLLPDDPELLTRLAGRQFAAEGSEAIQEQLLARAETLLPVSELLEAERLFLRGSIHAARKRYPEAIECYKEAVALRSYDVEWRYELARLLQGQGLLDEAHEQARRCARLEPRELKHRKLLEEIHNARLLGTGDRGQRSEVRGRGVGCCVRATVGGGLCCAKTTRQRERGGSRIGSGEA
jgi:O-antigen ligase